MTRAPENVVGLFFSVVVRFYPRLYCVRLSDCVDYNDNHNNKKTKQEKQTKKRQKLGKRGNALRRIVSSSSSSLVVGQISAPAN
jgi:hypothetical protein